MERFAKIALESLNSALKVPIQLTDLEIPPDPQLGDFALPCFKLAQSFQKSPNQVAQLLCSKIQDQVTDEILVSTQGPYLNFTVRPQKVLSSLLKDILLGPERGHYGSLPKNSRGKWVIEYGSPNVAKPLNIYHLRTTVLGASLDRVARYRGYEVSSINHLGDWGKQYGMLAVAFERYHKTVEDSLSLTDLVELYVKINSDAEKDPTIEIQAKQAFLDLEKEEPKITQIWKKCIEISLQGFRHSYQRLNIHFDYIWGESHYKNQLIPLIENLKTQGILVQSEGAWIVPLVDENNKELTPCILQKNDGGTLYATRDIAAALYRHKQFAFDRMTYVVGADQKLHFKQIFGVLKKMGVPWVKDCEHIPTGLYRFKDAKMSTRKGNFVTLEEVLALAKQKVITLMQDRGHTSPPAQSQSSFEEIAEKIAIGAIVFHDLHNDPARDVEFDIERVVDFEGETGPYLQYAHTRCLSILRKASTTSQSQESIEFSLSLISLLNSPSELQLIKTLGQFPLHLERTLRFSKASQLAHFLIEVTRSFGVFYRQCQVLGHSTQLTQARLMLVEATRRVLAQGLTLLGVPLPEWM